MRWSFEEKVTVVVLVIFFVIMLKFVIPFFGRLCGLL